MSTVNDPRSLLDETSDPFFYGWRPVYQTMPDGTYHLENIPLTREDVLHPQEGDHIVQSNAHQRDFHYLYAVFRAQLHDDPEAMVLGDCGVDLSLEGVRIVCPDITVAFGVQDRDANRSVFDIALEGLRPSLIVEVVSPSTRRNDHENKMDLYYRAEVPVYVILDRVRRDGPLTIQGLRWTEDGYEEMETDERGRLWLDAVSLWLAAENNRAVCYDGEKIFEDDIVVRRKLIAAEEAQQAAETQAAQDRKAREAAEAEAANAKAQLAELLARVASHKNGGSTNPPAS